MLKIKEKRFVTLLETLIALALTVAVLSTLLFFYRQIVSLNIQDEQIQKEGFKLRYIENRLSSIIPQAVPFSDKNDSFFFTVSDPGGIFHPKSPISLIFTFDNGVDLNKMFSNHVLGRLFLDARGNFCLTTWPAPNRWVQGSHIPIKLEILLEKVSELKFSFFIAPDKNWQLNSNPATPSPGTPTTPQQNPATVIKSVVKPTPEGGWIHEWNHDYRELPALMKIEIVQEEKPYVFAFPLPRSKRQPTYTQ